MRHLLALVAVRLGAEAGGEAVRGARGRVPEKGNRLATPLKREKALETLLGEGAQGVELGVRERFALETPFRQHRVSFHVPPVVAVEAVSDNRENKNADMWYNTRIAIVDGLACPDDLRRGCHE